MRFFANDARSFGFLDSYQDQIARCGNGAVEIKSAFLRPYCVTFLDQRLQCACASGQVTLHSTVSDVNQYLRQCGFSFLSPSAPCSNSFPDGDMVPVRRFQGALGTIAQDVAEWASDYVQHFLPTMSETLGKRIVEKSSGERSTGSGG